MYAVASRFRRADHVVMGVPMWNFSFRYKLKQPIDLTCQRNMLFTFDSKRYGPRSTSRRHLSPSFGGRATRLTAIAYACNTVPVPSLNHLNLLYLFAEWNRTLSQERNRSAHSHGCAAKAGAIESISKRSPSGPPCRFRSAEIRVSTRNAELPHTSNHPVHAGVSVGSIAR